MVVVLKFVGEGNLVIRWSIADRVRVAVGLSEIIVVCAEAHGAIEGIARLPIFATDEMGGVCWKSNAEMEKAKEKER